MVRDRLGIPIGDSFFSDSVLDTNLNLAIAAFDSENRWPWNEATTTLTLLGGTKEVELPDDWSALRAVTYKHEVLEQMPLYDLVRVDDGAGSWFRWYAVKDRTLVLAPSTTLDTELGIVYYRQPLLMEDDHDVPRAPIEHINAIIAKACQLCAVREGERTEAGDHLIEYLGALARARKEVHRNMTRGVGRRIRPGAWI